MKHIDTATGLPKLPDDYFWRVRHHRIQVQGSLDYFTRTDTSRLQVQLIHKYTLTKPRTIQKRNWFGRKVWTTGYYEDVAENAVITEDALGTNPIAIQNAANRIMKLWAKAKERDRLVGDYPLLSL